MDILKRSTFVECDVKEVSEHEILTCITLHYGTRTISSVVATDGGYYVTFVSQGDADLCVDAGITVGEKNLEVSGIARKTIVVNIFGLPEFVTDEAVIENLASFWCELRGEIVWRKNDDDIYFGIRSVKVHLAECVSSLPYGLKIKDVLGRESFYQVRHNSQSKVCNGCLSSSHLYKECPAFICFRSKKQGHVARACPNRTPATMELENTARTKGGHFSSRSIFYLSRSFRWRHYHYHYQFFKKTVAKFKYQF